MLEHSIKYLSVNLSCSDCRRTTSTLYRYSQTRLHHAYPSVPYRRHAYRRTIDGLRRPTPQVDRRRARLLASSTSTLGGAGVYGTVTVPLRGATVANRPLQRALAGRFNRGRPMTSYGWWDGRQVLRTSIRAAIGALALLNRYCGSPDRHGA
jgi:hypothetical protein